jgi:tetratricopeptide (TPR) repeat protein
MSVRLLTVLVLAGLLQCEAAAAGIPCQPSRHEGSETVDKLLADLRQEADPARANRIAGRVISAWSQSGSATVDLLLSSAEKAAGAGRNEAALDLLDNAVALAPGHPDGWNRRAALHYSMNRFDKAMADLACVLVLEPRHFLAWSELAAIYRELDWKQQEFDALMQLLRIFPADREAQSRAGELAEELADRPL